MLIVIFAIVVVIGLLYLLDFIKRSLYFHPGTPVTEVPDVPYAEFTVDGIHGWRTKGNGNLTIFMCHGNAGSISNRIPFIHEAHKNGYSVVVFDYRQYGKSTGGSPSEKGLYDDAKKVWKHVGLESHNCIVYGESIGTAVATRLVVDLNLRPRALVLQSGFSSIKDFLPNFIKPLCPEFNTKKIINRVKCPVIIFHSELDGFIPFEHAEILYKNALNPKKLIKIRGDHNNPSFDDIFRFLSLFSTGGCAPLKKRTKKGM